MNENIMRQEGFCQYEIDMATPFFPGLSNEVAIFTDRHTKVVAGYVYYPLAAHRETNLGTKEGIDGNLYLRGTEEVWCITYLPTGRLWGNLDCKKYSFEEMSKLMKDIAQDLESEDIREVYIKYQEIL